MCQVHPKKIHGNELKTLSQFHFLMIVGAIISLLL